jgi:Xaa-Pro aminopeptidase
MQLEAIQKYLTDNDLDGWLIYDFHGQNRIAGNLFKMTTATLLTRRWYYFIPKAGQPQLLVHKIERDNFPEPPERLRHYLSLESQIEQLKDMLSDCKTVAMEYSPECAIPYISCVDAGTIELLRGIGLKVVSSADLVQEFQSKWNAQQVESHSRAALAVDAVKDAAFQLIAEKIKAGDRITEMDVARFILDSFEKRNMTTVDPPIVAVNANASNPHYVPTPEQFSEIKPGDLVLIDLFSKEKEVDAIYADITWMGFVGESIPERQAEVFKVVTDGRDAGMQLLREAAESGRTIHGFEVDNCVRGRITAQGYGDYFDHRTGHSLDTNLHGNGVNIDGLESRDNRKIVPGMGFTIEPGIYLPEFGVRSEINVYFSEQGPKVFGPIQSGILPLL